MPINSIQRQGGGMPKIGQLRKGAIKATNAPGRNLSYFRFVSNFPEVVQAFEAEYGKEPARLEAIIPAQLNEAWDYWMECWKGGGLVRRCDQNSIVLKLVDGRYQVGQFPCWCAANPNAKKEDLCNEAGRLKLFLPKLGRWGYVELVTGAWWDITEITRCLQDIENRAGTLIGMPIILERVQKEVSHATPEGKRTRNKQWV
ncbi:hypothetical protein PZC41_14510, partial [Staphylococcus aureus]|uniref:recombination directionality factor n=1 Tax=Staphylococcus aureus TaxID=1280 RepID=UPI0023B09CE3